MGYTHFNRVSSTSGYSVGAKGSESVIIDSSGNITTAGAITATGAATITGNLTVGGIQQNTKQGILTWDTGVLAAGSNTVMWSVAPYACTMAGYVCLSVSSGTGRTVTVEHGSAGDVALTTATVGVSGTIGAVLTFTTGTVTFTAGECFRIVTTTCATAQQYGVTVILTKT